MGSGLLLAQELEDAGLAGERQATLPGDGAACLAVVEVARVE
jgi:hypothetical protein